MSQLPLVFLCCLDNKDTIPKVVGAPIAIRPVVLKAVAQVAKPSPLATQLLHCRHLEGHKRANVFLDEGSNPDRHLLLTLWQETTSNFHREYTVYPKLEAYWRIIALAHLPR